jgi:Putative beta-barrel porin-2, OmpL-like. bbp2
MRRHNKIMARKAFPEPGFLGPGKISRRLLVRLFPLLLLGVILRGSSCAAQALPQMHGLPESPAPQQAPAPGFWARLGGFYREDWHPTQPPGPAPPRRGLPSPLDSPPFPNADWSYGGSPTIGEADTNSYPLMSAWNEARSRTKVYGWVEPTVNGSTSSHRNAPVANDLYSNRLELDQIVVYVERLPDSVQQDHIDFGFHLTGLYGTDYRYTTDKGYLSFQLLKDMHQYGFDPALEYVDIYFPHVAQGMNLRIGRYISIPGIEAQLAPNNYMFSHSLLYSVDPFTDTGALASIQVTGQTLLQLGITASHDVAPWTPDAKPSATVCVSHTAKSVNNNFYLCANGINDGKYAYNNLQQYDATWYHKFSKTWHMATEVYSMYQREVPSVYGPIKPQTNTNGATCLPGPATCFAPEYAAVNYINKELGPHTFLSFRSDLLNDKKGQRTGYNTKYTENTLMLAHWIGSTVQIRPEIRFDRAWDRKAYDEGRRQSQLTVASDLIFHF